MEWLTWLYTIQESWNQLQQQDSGDEASASGNNGTLLLRVIANSAARFPAAQAAQLAADLLKVSLLPATMLCLLPPKVHPTGKPNIHLSLGLFFHHCHTAYFFPFFCPLLFAANEYIQHVPTLTYLMQAVERFGLSPTAAAAHIAALAQLTASRGEAKVSDSAAASQKPPHTTAWGSIVLQGAEEELGRFVEQVPVLSSVVS